MISPAGEDFWGDSWLTGSKTFGAGDTLTFDDNLNQVVDIQVLGCDTTRLFEGYNIDLAANNQFTIKEPVVLARYEFTSYDGWSMGGLQGGTATITQGDYYTITTQAGDSFSSGAVDFTAQNITVRTDASLAKAGADSKAVFGVMCRVQEDGSGIFFAVRSDGYGSIQEWDGVSLTSLTDWVYSGSIKTGIDANYIEGTCSGSNYSLYVNGDYVTDVDDTSFTDGRIGVAVVPDPAASVRVDFDFVEGLKPLE